MSRYILGIVLSLGLVTSANAVILPPTDDSSGTNTFSGRPPVVTRRTLTSLNGSATTLPVSKTRTAFVRFAVEESGYSAATVEKARLTLYLPTVTKVGDLSLHLVMQDWEETFSGPTRMQPTTDEAFMTIPWTSVVKRQFVILDVTQQVKDWLANPGTNFGFAVASPDGLAVVTLGSKEGSASGYPPLLEIEGTGATAENTPSSIVKRDGEGNFMVGTITGALVGNATTATTAGSATNFTGSLAGDVIGTQGATIIANEAITSPKIAPGAVSNLQLVNSGVTITIGNGLSGGGLVALGGTLNLANTGVLSLTGGGGITVDAISGAVTLGSTAASANTAGAIVARDANGDFVAGKITANSFAGDGSSLTGIKPRMDRQTNHLPGPFFYRAIVYSDLLSLTTKDLGEPGSYLITVSTALLNGTNPGSGTFAITVNNVDVTTQAWQVTDNRLIAIKTIANGVPPGSVISIRYKNTFSNTNMSVTDLRLTIEGVPQSYIVE